ncbi:MAG: hypothetical protein ACFFGP_14250 [Promethearchaeota archaeon]
MNRWESYEDESSEIEELAQEDEIPRGWRPSPQTIEAIQGKKDTPSEGEWEDRGIQDVSVDHVDLSDSPVQDAGDFHKVSHEEMVDGFRKLEEEVRPAVAKSADADDFSRLDEDRGLDYEHGYRRVYDAFYGNNSIRLDKVGDSYSVVNGYHRLAVARELGLKTVPARVIEKVGR